jgi:hypothetical protein
VVSSAGAANAGRRETKANKPADISLFMIRSYYDPASSARSKKKEFEEFENRSQESGARIQEARSEEYAEGDCFFEKTVPGAPSASRPRSS